MVPANEVSPWHIFVQQTLHSASCCVSGLPDAASSAARETGRSLWEGILQRSSRAPLFADIASSSLDAAAPKAQKRKKKRVAAKKFSVGLPEDAPPNSSAESPDAAQDGSQDSNPSAPLESTPEEDGGREAPSQASATPTEEGPESARDEEARAEEERRAARREARRARRAAAALGEDLPQEGTPEEQKTEEQKQKEDMRTIAEAMQQLTPEERQQVYAWHWKDGLDKRKVKVGGKKVLLSKVLERKYGLLRDMGGFEPMLDNRHPIDRRAEMPSESMRPGAEKMELRLEDHLRLPLDLLGRGNAFRPERWMGFLRGGQRDYAFGIYGRRQAVENVLAKRWANRDPEEVLFDELFYQDIIDQADRMELNLMAVATRPLPFEPLRDAFIRRLQKSMATAPISELERLTLSKEDERARRLLMPDHVELVNLYHAFDKERMQKAGLVSEKGELKEGTHLIFSALGNFHLGIEGIQPGAVRDRKSVIIGTFTSPLLTRSVFDLFLGPFPINAQSKLQIGQGALYAANGFTFDIQTAVPNQFLDDKTGPMFDDHFSAEILKPTLSAFRMYSTERSPGAGQPLLTGLAEATYTPPTPKEQRKRFLFF